MRHRSLPALRHDQLGFGGDKDADAAGGFFFLAVGTTILILALFADLPGLAWFACFVALLGFWSIFLGGHGWAGIALMIEAPSTQRKRIANLVLAIVVPPVALGALTIWLLRHEAGWLIWIPALMMVQTLFLLFSVFEALRNLIAEHLFPLRLPFAFTPIQMRVDADNLEVAMQMLAGLPQGWRFDEFRHRLLLQAAKSGNAGIAEKLLASGAPVHRQASGMAEALFGGGLPASPLPAAAAGGNVNIVRMLLERGGDVKAAGSFKSPLAEAAANGHVEIVKMLLDGGADVKAAGSYASPLAEAAANGHANVVKMLVERGADVNAVSPSKSSPLHRAAEGNHGETVRVLLMSGANVDAQDSQGTTPLLVALQRAARVSAEALIAVGADINAPNRDGKPVIHLLVDGLRYTTPKSAADVVALAVSLGADIDARDRQGRSPLHHILNWAVPDDMMKVLLDAGANIDARDEDGRTPLFLAQSWICAPDTSESYIRGLRAMDLLVDAGADWDAADKNGRTPRMIAAQGRGAVAGGARAS